MLGIYTLDLSRYSQTLLSRVEGPDAIQYFESTFQNIAFSHIILDPSQYNFSVILPAEEDNNGPNDLTINGGYFEDDNSPSGLLVSGTQEISPFSNKTGLSGVFFVRNNKASIIWAKDHQSGSSPQFAVQSGPLIIEPGGKRGIRSKEGALYRRTILAVDKNGKLHIIIIKTPASLYACQELLLNKIQNVDAAINLDGGPSTHMKFRLPGKKADFGESNSLPYLIRISPKNHKK